MFTTVAAYLDPIEAQLALGLLQAEGIPARLDDSGTAIANWEWRLAIGGMRLRVPEAQAPHARRVLAALDAGEYALDDGTADVGHQSIDGGRELAPLQPPSRESLSSRLAWVALMLFGLPLPWRRDRGTDDAAVRRA
jgi:hypothetical protein